MIAVWRSLTSLVVWSVWEVNSGRRWVLWSCDAEVILVYWLCRSLMRLLSSYPSWLILFCWWHYRITTRGILFSSWHFCCHGGSYGSLTVRSLSAISNSLVKWHLMLEFKNYNAYIFYFFKWQKYTGTISEIFFFETLNTMQEWLNVLHENGNTCNSDQY